MSIDKKQLEINVNLYTLDPSFRNAELHYVIAKDEKSFRFADWNEEPKEDEHKFYCFLSEEELFIPTGNITLTESYVLKEEPVYPEIKDIDDFNKLIEQVKKDTVAKGIRCFTDNDFEKLFAGLKDSYESVEKHIVKSDQGQHLLLLVDEMEISVSAAMVYFRNKTPIAESHYKHVKEEQQDA